MKNILKNLIQDDILNFKSHDEGNYDVDRLDFILRDSIYRGQKIEKGFDEQYKRKYAKLDKNGNIMQNEDGSIILVDEESQVPKKIIDVYNHSSLSTIENFLERRVQSYKNGYFSKITQVEDGLVGVLFQNILNSKSDGEVAKDLKSFIHQLKKKGVDIDLDEYLKWDDIRFYSNCIDIAENSNNDYVRDLSGMTIPNLQSLMNLIYSHLDLKNAKKSNFQTLIPEHKYFIHKIKNLIYGDTHLSRILKDKGFFKRNCLMSINDNQIEFLKEHFGDTIHYSTATVYGYKKNIPIYIQDKNGKIFAIHNHPERSCNWSERKEQVNVAFVTIPELRLQGLSDDEINRVKRRFYT